MVLFRAKPNLSDGEKARLEFYYQQIAECIGSERLRLPVIERKALLNHWESNHSIEKYQQFLGDHLGHDAESISVRVAPQIVANCSGGG